jgi:hypothetical protein
LNGYGYWICRASQTLVTKKPKKKKPKLRGLSPQAHLYQSSDRRLSAKLVLTFAARGCHVVSVTDPYAIILGYPSIFGKNSKFEKEGNVSNNNTNNLNGRILIRLWYQTHFSAEKL